MPKFDPSNATLLEVALQGTGSMLKAARVVAFIEAWGIVRDDLEREPTMAEYVAYWHESRSTAYDHLAEFRQVFDAPTPGPVLAIARAGRGRRYDLSPVAARLTAA